MGRTVTPGVSAADSEGLEGEALLNRLTLHPRYTLSDNEAESSTRRNTSFFLTRLKKSADQRKALNHWNTSYEKAFW
jgi:hypothetical protein